MVAHAQVPAEVHILAQRQHASRAQQPSVPDDDGAIVHGSLDEEDVFQKLTGNGGVQHCAAADHVIQQNLPLEHDQCAGAALGHLRAGQHRLADGLLHDIPGLRMGEEGDEPPAAHLLQNPADLRLKQDDQRQHAQVHHTA